MRMKKQYLPMHKITPNSDAPPTTSSPSDASLRREAMTPSLHSCAPLSQDQDEMLAPSFQNYGSDPSATS